MNQRLLATAWMLIGGLGMSVAPAIAAGPLELPAGELEAAVAASPEASMAEAELQQAQAQAQIERSSPQGWLARGASQSRSVTADRRYDEWDASLEHGLRLPGKRRLDRSVGELEIARALSASANVRRTVAAAILDDWYQCIAAAARHSRASDDLRSASDLKQSVARRHELGEAAQMDLTLAEAELAAVQSSLSGATEELRWAQNRLTTRGINRTCDVQVPTALPPVASLRPAPASDPAVRAAAAATELAHARAARARAERWADPSIGMRYAQERAGLERIVGVFVSIPLPSRRLAAEADRAAAQSRLAESEQRQIERQTALHKEEILARIRTARARWTPLDESARLQSTAAQQARRAYILGESDLSTALAALRSARTARGQAQDCALDVMHAETLAKLFVEDQFSAAAVDESTSR